MKKTSAHWYDRRRRKQKDSSNKGKKTGVLRPNETKFEIASWNVEEKGSPADIDKLLTDALKENPDVVCLQKANHPAANTETDNYKWLCSGASGSAILINKSANLVPNSFDQICDQICVAELSGQGGFKINIISCYIPPVTDYLCEELWAKLKEVIGAVPPTVLFVLAGDFNAHLGKDDWQLTVQAEFDRKRVYHELSNENGKKLSELIRKCHLKLFIARKKNSCELFTFNDGTTKSQQSFISVPFLRQSFAGEGYNLWHPNYNHALLRFGILYSPTEVFNFGAEQEGSAKKPPPVIASWNIQNATPAKVDNIMNEHNMPIVCIQELFLTSDEDIQTDNYTWHSTNKLWAKNVGILVKKSPNILVSGFESISEYLCVATVMFFGKPLIVISTCLPAVSDPQHDKVVSQIKELTKGIPEEAFTVLGGDFSSVTNPEGDIINADEFVVKIASETKMGLVEGNVAYRRSRSITQITEAGKFRSHYIMLSQSALKTLHVGLYCRWTPLFENIIVCVTAKEIEERPKKFSLETLKTLDNPVSEFKENIVGGVSKRIINFKMSQKEDNLREDIASLISADDIDKFKDTPPSPEDLSRMLKDLVLVHGANRRSSISSTPLAILVKSLSECKLGMITVEDITESKETQRKICKIIWRGILLAEEVATEQGVHQIMRNKAVNSIIAKLSQTCYTIKAKKSFFNKGMQPLLMESPDLADILKKVDKSSYPIMEDLFKHIDEFISKDTEAEFIFGTDFSQQDLLDIAEYAYNNNELMDFRFFKSKTSVHELDHLAVFRKRSPQDLRDMLIKEPKNFKYYLINPCGLGVDYIEFNKTFSADVVKEEYKLLSNAQSTAQKPKGAAQRPKGEGSHQEKKPPFQQNVRAQGQGQGGRKRDFNSMNSNQNGSALNKQSQGTSGVGKKQRLDSRTENTSFKVDQPMWRKIRPLVIVWPITVRSQLEERPEQVLTENFNIQFKTKNVNGQNVTAAFVVLTHDNGYEKTYCLAKGNTTRVAARIALDQLVKHSTVIKLNPSFLCNGYTPNFIRYKVPCQFSPRTYLILDRRETGPLTLETIQDLIDRFLNSNEEEMYFDRDSYSFKEKLALVENVPKLSPQKLLVRHFGDDNKLNDRYVCVYKPRPKHEILQEVLKMRGMHPKYSMTTNRLPPGIDYNIF